MDCFTKHNLLSLESTCTDIEEGLRFRSGKTLEKLLDIESVEDCRDECQGHNECTGWVWYSLSAKGDRPKQCWLKDVAEGKQKEPSIGVFSGQCTGKLFTYNAIIMPLLSELGVYFLTTEVILTFSKYSKQKF